MALSDYYYRTFEDHVFWPQNECAFMSLHKGAACPIKTRKHEHNFRKRSQKLGYMPR